MIYYIFKRIFQLIPILFLISIVAYTIIELPPGDFADFYISSLRASGVTILDDEAMRIKEQYGFNAPLVERYWRWVENIILRGNFGYSFEYQKPVNEILSEKLPLTVGLTLGALFISWSIAIPIGIYSAINQYSKFDYFFTFIGFLGLATPPFLAALIFAWLFLKVFDYSVLGLYSPEYVSAEWSFDKFIDLCKHLILPIILIGLQGTGTIIRVMRGNLLDELKKPYVVTAKAKGLKFRDLLIKYSVRMAINPIISTIGWLLPALLAGEILISIVLGIQTLGPVLLRSVLSQDMWLAASIVMILSFLTIIGSLISDILLVLLDPRIRYERLSK
jgi:peptide/nickel transport system permease protein